MAPAIADTNLDDVDVTNAKLFLLSQSEAGALSSDVRKCIQSLWWLRTLNPNVGTAFVFTVRNGELDANGCAATAAPLGVRPALRLDLSKTIYTSVNITGGAHADTGTGEYCTL